MEHMSKYKCLCAKHKTVATTLLIYSNIKFNQQKSLNGFGSN